MSHDAKFVKRHEYPVLACISFAIESVNLSAKLNMGRLTMDNTMHILVVEDTPVAQVVVKSHLVAAGCTVDIASDGESALDKALHTHYDLILMDIGLGDGMNGFETTAAIKNQSDINRTTPVMAVTAHNESEYSEKATASGMAGYFEKPFMPQDAQKVIGYIKQHPSNL